VSDESEQDEIRRVLILSADIGSGHLVAARTLAADLERRGLEVSLEEDLRASLGWLGRLVIRDGSRVLFDHAPRFYDVFYRLMLRFPPARASSAMWLRLFGARRLLRLVRRHEPDVVVSTYPGITVVLGELRRRRRLAVAVAAVITDLAGLFFWAHRGVDMHLLAWAESRPEVERISRATNVVHVLAPTQDTFFARVDPAAARERLGLPATGRIVLVSGGGWGVGNLEGTVAAALAADPDLVIALSGSNEAARAALERRFAGEPRVRVLGYTTAMSDLLAAADALVHATAGVTCLEAALRGCPTIVHGFPVGHVRHNAEVMTRLGLVTRATGEAELADSIRATLSMPRPLPASARLPSAAEVVMAVRPRIRPIARWRLALRRVTPATASLFVAALSTGTGYALAAHVEDDIAPISRVAVTRPEAAVVVRPSPDQIEPTLEWLAETRTPAALALDAPPPPAIVSMAANAGVAIVPALGRGQVLHWFRTVSRLSSIQGDTGDRSSPYVVPDRGFTLGQYVLARGADGYPVRPLAEPPSAVRAGDVVAASDAHDVYAIERSLTQRGIALTGLAHLVSEGRALPG